MYANPRALEAPEIRHIIPHYLMATTLDAPGRAVECAEVDAAAHADSSEEVRRQLLAGLTRREGEVAVLMARGLTNKQIGKALGTAEGTVKLQATALMRRLGLTNRASVAVKLAPLASVGKSATLTPATERVVRLLLEGLSNLDIATRLGVRRGTVCSHLREAFELTGATSRAGLAAWAAQNLPAEG